MVKFTKDGSTATTAAVKLARAHTGRDLVGHLRRAPVLLLRRLVHRHDHRRTGASRRRSETRSGRSTTTTSTASRRLFESNPGQIAAVILEAARTDEPAPRVPRGPAGSLPRHGAVLVFDEMITGFRWHLRRRPAALRRHAGPVHLRQGAGQRLLAVRALRPARDHAARQPRTATSDNVFLLSTTHGAETPCAGRGDRDDAGLPSASRWSSTCTGRASGCRTASRAPRAARGLEGHFGVVGRACNLLYSTLDADGQPSQAFRTLFLQETIRRGVLMPSLVVSYSHQRRGHRPHDRGDRRGARGVRAGARGRRRAPPRRVRRRGTCSTGAGETEAEPRASRPPDYRGSATVPVARGLCSARRPLVTGPPRRDRRERACRNAPRCPAASACRRTG